LSNFWTTLEVLHEYSDLYLPTMGRKEYNKATFRAAHTYKPWQTGANSYVFANEWDHGFKYLQMLKTLPRVFVVASSIAQETFDLFGERLVNCVAIPGNKIHKGSPNHAYFFPLHFHAAVSDWMSTSTDKKWAKLPRHGHMAWVEGKKWEQEKVCLACEHNLDMAADLCRPMTGTCMGLKELPFTVLPGHTGEGLEEARAWYIDHPMKLEYLDCGEINRQFTYMETKNVSTHDAFEKPHMLSITNNEAMLREQRDNRSVRSEAAARTKKVRTYLCDGCMRAGEYCSHAGGERCDGPWYGVDYIPVAEQCEPWMVWALEASAHNPVDLRHRVSRWSNRHGKEYTFAGPRGEHKIAAVRQTSRETDIECIPLNTACFALGVPCCNTWRNIERHSVYLKDYYGWPLPDWVKALAVTLVEGRGLHTYRQAMYHGSISYDLSGLDFSHASIYMEYSKGRSCGPSHRVTGLEDLYELQARKVHTREREEQNKNLHQLILDLGVRITARCHQYVIEKHPRAWKKMTAGQWKRRANKALRDIGGAKMIRKRGTWREDLLRAMKENPKV